MDYALNPAETLVMMQPIVHNTLFATVMVSDFSDRLCLLDFTGEDESGSDAGNDAQHA